MMAKTKNPPCPIGCGRRHSVQFLMCRGCWTQVGKELQGAIYQFYNHGPADKYMEVRQAAIDRVKRIRREKKMTVDLVIE